MTEIKNILLIGRTGSGKSTLANVLLNKSGNFEEVFKESDLPFLVELVSWKRMNPQFQELIKQDLIAIN